MSRIVSFLALLALCALAHANAADDVLSRYKAATGGERWNTLRSWHGEGTLRAGGLSGEFRQTVDVLTGRSVDSYELGPMSGGDGYDGKFSWTRDPGGEIATQDTPEALRRAATQAWLDAHAFWFPQRAKAVLGDVQSRDLDGKHFHVIEATPDGGDAVTLWFATDTGLLARVEQRAGQDTAVTTFDDYRDVQGLKLPFRSVTDPIDAAGRTDPRRRSEVTFDRIATNVATPDDLFAMPAMVATTRIDDASGVTRIPFDLVNNHIYVDGSVDGKKARFLVDTGGVNLLTPDAARKFGIVGEGKLAAGGVGSERADLAMAHGKQIRVGTAVLDKPVFYIIDLGKLASVEGATADGLVGYEMFRRFVVEIDYAKKQLTLTDPARFAPPSYAKPLAFALDDRIPIVAGTLDGVPLRMSVDTGSRSSLTLHAPFAREHGLVEKYHAAPESVLGWGVGGPSRERAARLGTLRLGDYSVAGIAAEIFTGDKGSFANPDIGGNLGGGVLRRFTVTFDYANRKMYLRPNADFAKADAFDRSGLWVLWESGALLVADVAPLSAAARAGLHENDRITSIDGKTVDAGSIVEWRRKFRELAVGTRIPIVFDRDWKSNRAELQLAERIPARFK